MVLIYHFALDLVASILRNYSLNWFLTFTYPPFMVRHSCSMVIHHQVSFDLFTSYLEDGPVEFRSLLNL